VSSTVNDPLARPFLDALGEVMSRARESNRDSLPAAAALLAGVVAGDGIIYMLGTGHSQLAALDLNRRAGSLAPLQVIFDPMWGRSELVEGYGATLLSETTFSPSDCLVVISNSGVNPAPIEVALAARAAGTPIVAVTSTAISAAARPRHSSGKRLFELADVVLDNGSVGADVALRVGEVGVGATSTLVASALLHETIVEAVFTLAARGIDLPVYRANSEDGGREHNARLRQRYRGRLNAVP
jgi:uncharacterized phosphosugar-binding protein